MSADAQGNTKYNDRKKHPMKPFARIIVVSFLALVGVVTTHIILKRRRKRRDAECAAKTRPQGVQPLRDDVAKNVSPRRFKWLNLCDNHYSALVKSLEKQLARRPNVWGAGLWPDAETEDIARKCAGLIKPYGGMLNDFLIPGDPLDMIAAFCGDGVKAILGDVEEEFRFVIDAAWYENDILSRNLSSMSEHIAIRRQDRCFASGGAPLGWA